MLQELLQTEMQKFTTIIEKKDEYIKLKIELEEKIARLKSEQNSVFGQWNELYEQLNAKQAAQKTRPLVSLINGTSQQIKKMRNISEQLSTKYNEKMLEYQTEEEVANPKIRQYQEQLQIIEGAEQQLKLMESDQNYAIKKLIKENPSLLENEEFVSELIDVSMEYIALDRTDSKNVYFKYLGKACEEIEKQKKQMEGDEFSQANMSYALKDIKVIMEEIQNPKLVPNEKYKIPHKFLFEALRRQMILEPKDDKMKPEISRMYNVSGICRTYQNFDGKCTLTTGKKMEELYSDEKSDLYFHQTSPKGQLFELIYRNGLRLSSVYSDHMDRTTVSQTQINGHFLNFLGMTSSIKDVAILSIPKNDGMILGNNTSPQDDKYILPEYIVGKMTQNQEGDIELIENPIPINERTVYKYQYLATKTNEFAEKVSPVTAVKNALSQGTTVDATRQAATIENELLTEKTYDRRRGVTKDD